MPQRPPLSSGDIDTLLPATLVMPHPSPGSWSEDWSHFHSPSFYPPYPWGGWLFPCPSHTFPCGACSQIEDLLLPTSTVLPDLQVWVMSAMSQCSHCPQNQEQILTTTFYDGPNVPFQAFLFGMTKNFGSKNKPTTCFLYEQGEDLPLSVPGSTTQHHSPTGSPEYVLLCDHILKISDRCMLPICT